MYIIKDLNDYNKNDIKIYKSTDFGNSWIIIDVNDRLRSLKMVDKFTGYAAICPIDSGAYIVKTTDGGFNWTNVYQTNLKINDGTPSIKFISTFGNNTVGVFGIYPFCTISTDGGKTWPDIGYGTDYTSKCHDAFLVMDAVFHQDGHIYALTSGIMKSKLKISTDVQETLDISDKHYPNPASDFIIIQLSESLKTLEIPQIQIYNELGEIVLNTIISQLLGENIRIDISKLVSGLYFIKIGNRVDKFVKI